MLSLVFALVLSNIVSADQTSFAVPYPPILSVSSEQWNKLNASVYGRLSSGVPFAKPCFSRFNGVDVPVDENTCQHIRKNYQNETLRTSQPAALINTQWESCQAEEQSCLLDFTSPFDTEATKRSCRLGSVSTYYIDVREPSDISAAFSFSRLTHVPLVIKNTGHDYKGRSSAPHSLGLWTHNLKEMTYSPNFRPAGCLTSEVKAQPALTLGAGVRWFEAYAFAQEHNVTAVGGADPTVGAVGGWLQGGGHGALSNTMGMGVDRVLEYVAITPDGITRTINACQNQDLFFALRGGGGGTFAVVLEATMLVDPITTIQAALVQFPIPEPAVSTARTRELWNIIVENSLQWAREGWGAYVNANSALYINPVMDKAAAGKSIAPLVEFGKRIQAEDKAKGDSSFPAHLIVQGEYDSWAHFYNTFAHDNSADLGEPLAIASRLIPSISFETPASRKELLDALIATQTTAPGVRFLVTTPFNYPGTPGKTAIHPAWRTSVLHVTTVTTWNWNTTLNEVEEKYATVGRAIDNLRQITKTHNAAYVNEADINEPNHEDTFWGENYPKLLAIKNKYDPERLLDCWHCVGWTANSARYSCYL